MATKLFPWPIAIVFISYVVVTSGTRVYPQPGVVLEDSGYSLVFEDVKSIAVNIMIRKPNLKVPDCVTEDLADMVDKIDYMNTLYNYTKNISDIAATLKLYKPLLEMLKSDVEQEEEELRFQVPGNSDIGSIHYMMNRLWYGSDNDIRKKIVALEKGEQELEYVFYLSKEADKLEKIRLSEHLLVTQEEYDDEDVAYFDFDDRSVNFMMFSVNKRFSVQNYIRRLRQLNEALSQVSRRDRRPSVKVVNLVSYDHLLQLVEGHDIFDNTIFKEHPMYLNQFAELAYVNITTTDEFLSVFATITFPLLRQENILPQFNIVQVGYMFTQDNKTRCVKHLLPEQVTLFNGAYYEIECDRRMPELCRVNFINMITQQSCFHGDFVDCVMFPIECDTVSPLYFEEGLLISTSQTVQRLTEESHVENIKQQGDAIFIPWEETVSVVVGDEVHHNPYDMSTRNDMKHTNESFIFDIDIRYSEMDLAHLLKYNINFTTNWPEEEAMLRFINEQRKNLEAILEVVIERERQATLKMIISISISLSTLTFGIVAYWFVKKSSWCQRKLIGFISPDVNVM